MAIDHQTQLILQALEEAGAENPGLSAFCEYHCALLQLLGEARGEIAETLEMADEEALQARLHQGLQLLSFDQLPVKADRFAELVSSVAQVLSTYDPVLADQEVPDSPAECLALARRRFVKGQVGEEQDEVRAEEVLAQMAVDLALKPFLEWAAEQVMPYVDQERWKRGRCPVCGGAPDFAALDAESGARHLLCSRCNSQWRYHRLGCPFCDVADHARVVYYPSEDGVYRLYVCRECRHYLKTIDLRETARTVLLPVERVTTVSMDVAAHQEGYRA